MIFLITTLFDLCNDTQKTGVTHCGRSFKRLIHDVIVKYGWSVTADEATNQKHAHLYSRGKSRSKNRGDEHIIGLLYQDYRNNLKYSLYVYSENAIMTESRLT
jgi:hypothetical protein